MQQVDQDPAEQQRTAENVHQQITVSGRLRLRRAAEPHHEQRRHRHQLPKDEQRDPVAGEHDSEAAAGIDQGGGVLAAVPHVQGIQNTDAGDKAENQAEHVAQGVHSQDVQRVVGQRP